MEKRRKASPNTSCLGQWGFIPVFGHFSCLVLFRLPSQVHTPAGNTNLYLLFIETHLGLSDHGPIVLLFSSNYSQMAIHHVSLVLPLEKETEKQVLAGATHPASTCFTKNFPSPIGFLANGGGDRGGGLSNYIFYVTWKRRNILIDISSVL
jgi:hypothetical protein